MIDLQASIKAGKMAYSSGFTQWNPDAITLFLELKNSGLFYFPKEPEFSSFILYQSVLDEAEILLVIVEKEKRDQGIGKNLMKNFLQFLERKDIRRVFLEVAVNNLPAIHLYKHFGFKQISVRKKYYNNTTDALIMEKIL